MKRSYCWNVGAIALLAIAFFALISLAGAQTFSVSANPSSLTIYPGQQNVPITVTVNSGDNDSDDYSGPIVVTVTGLPSGISVTPVTLTAGSSGTLYLSTSLSAGQEGFSPSATSQNTSWTASSQIVAAAGSSQVLASFPLTVSISNPSFSPAQGNINLPIVTINTTGDFPINSKIDDVPGTITITSADGQTSYLPNSSDTDNTATFHVHGNSTADMPKLPYHVKLNTSVDLFNVMGLSCPYVAKGKSTCDKSKSYILLANYDDKTFLRDWSASALANAIPYGSPYLNETPVPSPNTGTVPTPSGTSALMPWAPHSLFVELYLNGVYEGNYQLIEEVKVDSHRVNITEMDDTAISGDALTGGYLLEIDQENGEDFMFDTPQNVDVGLVDPDFTPEVPEQTSYIQSYIDNAETALFSTNFTDPTLGWRAFFDEASAVNFYIVNDVMGNEDGGRFYSSDYLYKDINNPLIYMGPVWDFDVSSGNVNYDTIVNPTAPWMQVKAPWYAQWFKDPGFKADVIAQWNALQSNGVFTSWLASIQQESASLEQSQANNFGRWPMQGLEVWPNSEAAGSYDGEVAYLTNWLNLRIAYLDSVFNNKAQTATTLTVPGGTLRSGSAAALTAQVTGGSSLSGSVSFLSNGLLLGTVVLNGSSATLTATNLPAGTDNLVAVYAGDAHNGLSASNPQSVTVAPPLIGSVSSLGVSPTSLSEITPANFTVSVLGNSGQTIPTGTVNLMLNGNLLSSSPLSGTGTAAFTMNLPIGADSVNAIYSGDSNFASSTSNLLSLNVITVPDFALSASQSLVHATPDKPGKVTLTITPQYGFNQAVSFSCSVEIAGSTCSFSPATVTPQGGPITTLLTLSAPSTQNNSARSSLPLWSKIGSGIGLAMLLWPFRRRRLRILIALTAMLAAGLAMTACGTRVNSSTRGNPPSVGSVVVTATGGGASHAVTISLEVTQ